MQAHEGTEWYKVAASAQPQIQTSYCYHTHDADTEGWCANLKGKMWELLDPAVPSAEQAQDELESAVAPAAAPPAFPAVGDNSSSESSSESEDSEDGGKERGDEMSAAQQQDACEGRNPADVLVADMAALRTDGGDAADATSAAAAVAAVPAAAVPSSTSFAGMFSGMAAGATSTAAEAPELPAATRPTVTAQAAPGAPFAGVFAEYGGNGAALSDDGAELAKASRGGWAHGASGVLACSMCSSCGGGDASTVEEHTLRIVGGQLRNLYVGVVPATFGGVGAAAGIAEEDAWFMLCASGSLFGHGKNWDDAAGAVPQGSALTLRLDSSAGTLTFLLDGKPHGPGYTGVTGAVKLCVSMGSGSSAVRILG